ncbi:restriction endonuclease subunit S [Ligilactobacillus murinus]|uniref:restriction endonuclease subunit S n=2 Tax=Ligilactobacillus murinus TaxID=1622 RepID=UPI002DD64E4A|nr:restriction endonuclease subunit S [Ligilactobacillus murinus]WRY36856.1 restriction endonuclease subunit S [Ligilactobacillus murinus]
MIDTKALREKILDLAMRGKLVPQDPNDEPASELLKRIKAEKEELIKQKKIKRDKNETEIFRGDDGLHYEKFADGTIKEIEVPYELPDGWEWARVRNIARIISGGTPKTSIPEYYGEGLPWITPAEMGKKQQKVLFEYPEKQITSLGLQKSSAQIVPEYSIVYSKRAPIGHINIVPFKYSTNQGCLSFVPILVDSSFYYYEIKNITNDIKTRASGTTFKEISATAFADTLVVLPPLKEQKRINKELIVKYEYIDQIDSNQKQLQKLATQLKQKVLDIAMQGKLVPQDPNDEPASVLLEKIRAEKQRLYEEGKIKKKDLVETEIVKDGDNAYYGKLPKTWIKSKLFSVANVIMGQSPKGNNVTSEFSLNAVEFHQGKSDFGEKFLNPSGKYTSQITKEIEIPSIVMSVRAPVGDVNLTRKTIVIGRGLAAIQPYGYSLEYLYHFLLTQKSILEQQATGTTFKAIGGEVLRNLPIALPAEKEQIRIVNLINSVFEVESQLMK